MNGASSLLTDSPDDEGQCRFVRLIGVADPRGDSPVFSHGGVCLFFEREANHEVQQGISGGMSMRLGVIRTLYDLHNPFAQVARVKHRGSASADQFRAIALREKGVAQVEAKAVQLPVPAQPAVRQGNFGEKIIGEFGQERLLMRNVPVNRTRSHAQFFG